MAEQVDTQKKEIEWEEFYVGMPEYNNVNLPEPQITATFKFRNKEDFDRFHTHIKQYLYNGERVFDGMQKKDKKSAWYPLNEKGSKYIYD